MTRLPPTAYPAGEARKAAAAELMAKYSLAG